MTYFNQRQSLTCRQGLTNTIILLTEIIPLKIVYPTILVSTSDPVNILPVNCSNPKNRILQHNNQERLYSANISFRIITTSLTPSPIPFPLKSPPTAEQSTLSIGAIIGITVACAVGIVFIMGGIMLQVLILNKKKNKIFLPVTNPIQHSKTRNIFDINDKWA
jgi:hypothetical protein